MVGESLSPQTKEKNQGSDTVKNHSDYFVNSKCTPFTVLLSLLPSMEGERNCIVAMFLSLFRPR